MKTAFIFSLLLLSGSSVIAQEPCAGLTGDQLEKCKEGTIPDPATPGPIFPLPQVEEKKISPNEKVEPAPAPNASPAAPTTPTQAAPAATSSTQTPATSPAAPAPTTQTSEPVPAPVVPAPAPTTATPTPTPLSAPAAPPAAIPPTTSAKPLLPPSEKITFYGRHGFTFVVDSDEIGKSVAAVCRRAKQKTKDTRRNVYTGYTTDNTPQKNEKAIEVTCRNGKVEGLWKEHYFYVDRSQHDRGVYYYQANGKLVKKEFFRDKKVAINPDDLKPATEKKEEGEAKFDSEGAPVNPKIDPNDTEANPKAGEVTKSNKPTASSAEGAPKPQSVPIDLKKDKK